VKYKNVGLAGKTFLVVTNFKICKLI